MRVLHGNISRTVLEFFMYKKTIIKTLIIIIKKQIIIALIIIKILKIVLKNIKE